MDARCSTLVIVSPNSRAKHVQERLLLYMCVVLLLVYRTRWSVGEFRW